MREKELINHILSLPYAKLLLDEVREALNQEQNRREQFYQEFEDCKKVEFINGEVIIHAPDTPLHNRIIGDLFSLIDVFVSGQNLGYVGLHSLMISLSRNDYEPDICFFTQEKAQHFQKGQSLFPAPDLIVEVLSRKTAKMDRGVKFEDYQSHGVLEYWIIDPKGETVEQYRLDEIGKYELILKTSQGPITCQVIKDFEITIEAIFDEGENMKELSRLLTL